MPPLCPAVFSRPQPPRPQPPAKPSWVFLVHLASLPLNVYGCYSPQGSLRGPSGGRLLLPSTSWMSLEPKTPAGGQSTTFRTDESPGGSSLVRGQRSPEQAGLLPAPGSHALAERGLEYHSQRGQHLGRSRGRRDPALLRSASPWRRTKSCPELLVAFCGFCGFDSIMHS